MSHMQRRRPPSPHGRDQDMYKFRGNSQHNFDFRPPHGHDAPSFPSSGAPSGRREGGPPRGPRRNNNQGGRGGYRRPATSERAILRARRSPTPEQMTGMNGGDSRFRVLQDIPSQSESEAESDAGAGSDSDAMDMEGESDREMPNTVTRGATSGDTSDEDDHPRAKRAKTNGVTSTSEGDAKPLWSNPDPYSLPVSENAGPKKDVVKMIRRAKVENDERSAQDNSAADFISFNFDDEANDGKENNEEGEISSSEASAVSARARRPSPRRDRADDRSYRPEYNGYRVESRQERVPDYPPSFAPRDAPDYYGGATARHPRRNSPSRENHHRRFSASPDRYINSRHAMDDDRIPPPPNHGRRIVHRTSQLEQPDDEYEPPPPPPSDELPPPIPSMAGMPIRGMAQSTRSHPVDAPSVGASKRKRSDEELAVTNASHMGRAFGDDVPWMIHCKSPDTDAGVWLDEEIREFRNFVKPTRTDRAVRDNLIQRVQDAIGKAHPGALIRSFGSFGTELYLPTGDMDLVALSSTFRSTGIAQLATSNNKFYKMLPIIERNRLGLNPQGIAHAKVPIIKYSDRLTGLQVDISFENDSGLIAVDTINRWIDYYPGLREMVYLIKHFLAQRSLNEVNTGGLGGYSIICMIVHRIHYLITDDRRPHEWLYNNLDFMLMDFLSYYGTQFDLKLYGLDMRSMSLIPKEHFRGRRSKENRMLIVDPNRSDNDISGGTAKIAEILRMFAAAQRRVVEEMDFIRSLPNHMRRRQSILKCILGGDYSAFEAQRQRMGRIFDSHNGSKGITVRGSANEAVATQQTSSDCIITGVRSVSNALPVRNNSGITLPPQYHEISSSPAEVQGLPDAPPLKKIKKPRAKKGGAKASADVQQTLGATSSSAIAPEAKKSKKKNKSTKEILKPKSDAASKVTKKSSSPRVSASNGDDRPNASRATAFKQRFPGVPCPRKLTKSEFRKKIAEQS